jgi:hypothetical protein
MTGMAPAPRDPGLGLSREAELLLLASAGEQERARFEALAHAPLDWERLTLLASRSRATAPLWRRLQLVPGLPRGSGAARLEWLGTISEFRISHIGRILEETIGLFARHQIEVMLLKGGALLAGGAERPLARSMSDLDVVVIGGSADQAWQLCLDAGWSLRYPNANHLYEGHHHLPPLVDPRGVGLGLEIHRAIFPGGEAVLGVDETAMAERARRLPIGASMVRVPILEDLLLHACLHFGWGHGFLTHGWSTFSDAHVIVADRRFSWERFVKLANSTAGGSCCYWTLRLARAGTGLSVPQEVLDALPGPMTRRIGTALERHFFAQLFDPTTAGTPVLLRQVMWQLAARPRRSGLGKSRPWQLGSPDVRKPVQIEGEATGTGRRFLQTMGYLWSLVRASGRQVSSTA